MAKKNLPIIINPGDEVSFLNEKGGGKVIRLLRHHTALILRDDGFEVPYPVDQLVPIKRAEPAPEPPPVEKTAPVVPTLSPDDLERLKELKGAIYTKRSTSVKHAKHSGILEKEVDLHYSELSDARGKKLSNAEIIQLQLNHFRDELENAISQNMLKITFIHGVGNGRLKTELRKILDTYEGIRYHDAPYHRYGFGATEVLISHQARLKLFS